MPTSTGVFRRVRRPPPRRRFVPTAPAGGVVELAGTTAGTSTAAADLALNTLAVGATTAGVATAAGAPVLNTLTLAATGAGTSTAAGDLTGTSGEATVPTSPARARIDASSGVRAQIIDSSGVRAALVT